MGALISPCGTYRYWLSRPCEVAHPETGTALFVMLNPSTADHTNDDPTIRRCRGFARRWGCNGLKVANLYALRSTDPAGLWRHPNPIGPDNDDHLMQLAAEHGDVVCAWGANAQQPRVETFTFLMGKLGVRLWCLGTTKAGAPRHPLYVKSDQRLVRWPAIPEA